MATTETLNSTFGISGRISFEKGEGDLTVARISSPGATALISLYGAHLLSYVPSGQKDIIWLSEKSFFEEGKAIRGGIPLCFPWFGPHASDKSKPQHGFARLQYWNVLATRQSGEDVIMELLLEPSEASVALWRYAFKAVATFVIGKTLQVSLTVTNTGNEAFEYSDALHTYFNIGNIDTVAIAGLQDARYYDGFGTELKTQQSSLLYFNDETNRRYVHTTADCIIEDNTFNRKIEVLKSGSKVTVVWNPAEATTKTIADMTAEGYKTFVCVEPANAYSGIDMIHLAPGASHSLSTNIQLLD